MQLSNCCNEQITLYQMQMIDEQHGSLPEGRLILVVWTESDWSLHAHQVCTATAVTVTANIATR